MQGADEVEKSRSRVSCRPHKMMARSWLCSIRHKQDCCGTDRQIAGWGWPYHHHHTDLIGLRGKAGRGKDPNRLVSTSRKKKRRLMASFLFPYLNTSDVWSNFILIDLFVDLAQETAIFLFFLSIVLVNLVRIAVW